MDFSRIDYLFNASELDSARVVVVGLGSGGAVVVDHLAMNGVRLWDLFDPDNYEEVNLVKHPRMRRDISRPKVEVQRDWLIDRNPRAEVRTYRADVLGLPSFEGAVRGASLVLSCTDNQPARDYVNDVCVRQRVPSVTASVFRRGIGGEVFLYSPGETGCYRCLQLYSLLNGLNLSDSDLGLTGDEEERIYGWGEKDYKASGLSIDIQMIALIQARLALGELLRGQKTQLPKMRANWIVFGNRPFPSVFSRHYECKSLRLRPQRSCGCSMANSLANNPNPNVAEAKE
jgi:molybdopterin/thiamine biosynthesis adenylyltransferase